MAKPSRARREEMRRLLAEQEASGLTVAEFARGRGLSKWTVYEWKRRLRDRLGPASRRDGGGFVEVKLVEEPRPTVALAVELGSGVRIHVPPGFEESELRRLLGVLASC